MILTPISQLAPLLISVLITVLSSSFTLAAPPLCTDLTQNIEDTRISSDPFVNSDKAEFILNHLIVEISSKFGSNNDLNSRLEPILEEANKESIALLALQEKIIDEKPVLGTEFKSFYTRLAKINDEAQKAATTQTEALHTQTSNFQKIEFNDLIVDPTRIESEKSYQITLNSGDTLSVIISENIVKNVFLSPEKTKVVSRSLRKIYKGIFGWKYSGDGIIRMAIDSTVVEVRSSGEGGNFRLFGYLENGNLHLVHYTISSDHSGSVTKKNAKQVIAIKEHRGH